MLIIFHYIVNLLYGLCKKHVRKDSPPVSMLTSDQDPLAEVDLEDNIKFDPPAFKQRYDKVCKVLTDEKWKDKILKVVDFGCAELQFFVFLKNDSHFREIAFVDIDEQLLRDYLFRVYPLNGDYINRRANPLTVQVYTGSIAQPDPCLISVDAVVAIEIVEHLYPDILEAVPYNLFSFIKPKLVVVTTPNSDFNILFPDLKRFRHYDHKFEWNREEFQSWAVNITNRFPVYNVQFGDIAPGPQGSEHLGACSQMAVFIRKDLICDKFIQEQETLCLCLNGTCNSRNNEVGLLCACLCQDCIPKYSYGICTYNSLSIINPEDAEHSGYKLLANIDYPYYTDTRSEEDKIMDELKFRVYNFGHYYEDLCDSENRQARIPLSRLTYGKLEGVSDQQLRSILSKLNYKVEECLNNDTKQTESCVIYEPEMDSGTSGNDTDASGYESDNNKPFVEVDAALSDWDEAADKSTAVLTEGPKTELHLEVGVNKKQQGALYDSGYQKSPPQIPDEAQQSIPLLPEVVSEVKNYERPNKLSNILSVFDNFDKVNELDAFRKEKKLFNIPSNLPHKEIMKKICQEIVKNPIAGPSRDPKRKSPKKSPSSDSEESVDEVKSIATCILENTLNKIEVQEEERRGDLIQELQEIEAGPVLIVENGDLANNNRDVEGNNYPENPVEENFVDNDNVNVDNNNEVVEARAEVVEPEAEEENIEEDPEVEYSSREALFDVNSQVDLLEDFDMDALVVNGIGIQNDYVIAIGPGCGSEDPVLPNQSEFPNWLLQIFEENEAMTPEEDLHDEPHFYCQGDGLVNGSPAGVHPSTVAVNDDDNDGDDEGDSDSESSTSGSIDLENTDAETSTSLHEVFITPNQSHIEDSPGPVSVPVVNQENSIGRSESEEVFENAEDSETNLVVDTVAP